MKFKDHVPTSEETIEILVHDVTKTIVENYFQKKLLVNERKLTGNKKAPWRCCYNRT